MGRVVGKDSVEIYNVILTAEEVEYIKAFIMFQGEESFEQRSVIEGLFKMFHSDCELLDIFDKMLEKGNDRWLEEK